MAFMATLVKRSKVPTMNDDQSSEDSRDFDVTFKSESELEDSEAESNSSNQSFKNWVRSLALDTARLRDSRWLDVSDTVIPTELRQYAKPFTW